MKHMDNVACLFLNQYCNVYRLYCFLVFLKGRL